MKFSTITTRAQANDDQRESARKLVAYKAACEKLPNPIDHEDDPHPLRSMASVMSGFFRAAKGKR